MLSNYGVAHVVRVLTGQETTPTTLYLALCDIVPTAIDTGQTISEPMFLDYVRTPLSMDALNWTVPLSGTDTSSYINQTIFSPTNDWGTMVGFALCDAAVDGNVIHFDSLQVPLGITAFSTVSIPPNALTIRAF